MTATDLPQGSYKDHPAPSVFLVLALTLSCLILASFIPQLAGNEVPLLGRVVTIGALAILLFYFWPIYSTHYTLAKDGIRVQYGPWTRFYPWSDFSEAYWQKGMFTMRIGWPSVTPCVRLTNAVVFKRSRKWRFALYLTPNEPQAFLEKVKELAPDLTRGTIF